MAYEAKHTPFAAEDLAYLRERGFVQTAEGIEQLTAERDAALVAVEEAKNALGEAENSLSIAKAEIASLKNREVDMITMIFDLHCKLEEQASELSDNTDLPTAQVKG